jgi:DNA-3-methyladenine glycosylase
MEIMSREFYERDPVLVAKDLLGKILVRKIDSKILSGKIVETEAYYSKEEDPASKAHKRNSSCGVMFEECGRAFIYMVHNNWLLNIVSHPKGGVGAVLIRALEPIEGIDLMIKNRGVKEFHDLTTGPGRLTKALKITRKLNKTDVTHKQNELIIAEVEKEKFEISSSHRIGVTKDLKQELRFFIKGNKFVSK